MGSIPGRVGNEGALRVFSFTAAGQDSGVFGVNPAPSAYYAPSRLWPVGWEKFTFQLTGSGTGYAITVYGTIDYQTSIGNGDEWFVLPGNSTDATVAQWSNPLQPGPNTSALNVKAPLLAVRATSDNAIGQTATGTVNLSVLVTS